ncbi:MAG: hypothetical protein D6702_06925 [Planctomycetota bacterium]|nr:MAG: hypothetical protein D6702_06925 [Planctomycetota bacterium]
MTAVTEMTWSPGGRRLRVKNADQVETTWTHNSHGQDLAVTYNAAASPSRTNTRAYDPVTGWLVSVTAPMGSVRTYHHDEARRVDPLDPGKDSGGELVGRDRVVFVFDDMDCPIEGRTQAAGGF